MASKYLDNTGLAYFWGKLKTYFQPKLVSGTNIKTINSESILGSGNITIEGGSGSSEYKKLLWTNPNASYSTGTVSLNLTSYDDVEVVFATDDGLVTEFSARCPVGKSGHGEWWEVRTDLSNYAAINAVTRNFSTTSTGVTFSNGQMIYNGASYNGWANRAIPVRIYGIKYERVDPPQMEVADCVVECNTDGTWYWRKWNSGLAECWAKSTSNTVNWTMTLPSFVTSIISVTTSSWVFGRVDTYDGYTYITGDRTFEHYSQTTGGYSGSRGCHVYALCLWKTFNS